MGMMRAGTPCDNFTIVSDMDGLAGLREEWQALFARAAEPHQLFQSFSFLWHWAQLYLEPGMRLCVIAVRRDGRLVMVLPLVRRRQHGVDVLRFMGLPVAQFGDVLMEPGLDEGLRRSAWSFVKGLGADLLEAWKMRGDAAFAALPADEPILLDAQQAPYADLAIRVGPQGPGPAYSARERSNYRRRMRRAAERGETRMRAEPPGDAAALLAGRAVAMKRDWLRRNAILSPSVFDPRFEAFFQAVARDPASDATLFATTLERNGEAIGIDLSFDCRGRSFGHVIALDAPDEKRGLGQILVQAAFAAAAARGNTVFDLMAPADAYKMRHADGAVPVKSLVFPFTPRGRVYGRIVLGHILPKARKFVRALPGWVRRALLRGLQPAD